MFFSSGWRTVILFPTNIEIMTDAQNIPNWQRLAEEASDRVMRAYRDCLRREGMALPGGVEALRPR